MSKADQVMEKLASAGVIKLVTKGLKAVDKGIRSLGRKVVSAPKGTKAGKKFGKKGLGKKISKKLDARKKSVQRAVGYGTAGAAAYGTKKIID